MGIYFITFTCFEWLHLIGKTNAYDVVGSFFFHLNQKRHQVVGYTIMPNHVGAGLTEVNGSVDGIGGKRAG